MSSAKPFDRPRDAAVAALLLLAAGCNYYALRHYVFEDAYITFRYAANLAAGHGFVFQPGERVLGTSAPLLTLVLGCLGFLGIDIPAAGHAISALAESAVGGLGYLLLRRRGAPNAGAVFAAAAVSGAAGLHHFFGLETALHVALVLAAAWLTAEERPIVTGLVLGLVAINRYDGVMAVAAVLLTLLLLRRRLPYTEALLAGAILGSWLLFAQLYFGHPLPNTYAAKAADVSFLDYAGGSLRVQAHTLLKPLHRLEPPLRLWPSLYIQVAIALGLPLLWRAGVALAGLFRRSAGPAASGAGPRERAVATGLDLAPLAFFALFLWLGYSAIGPPLEHPWYLVPATYALLLLALAAWARLLERLPAGLRGGAAFAITVAAALVLPWGVGREAAAMTSVAWGSDRIDAYGDMARWVRRFGFTETTLLTYEPGYITYHSGQRAIDAAGLVTPNIFYHGPKGRRSDLYELLERTRPELAVLGSPVMHEPGIRERRYLLALAAAPGRSLWIRRDFYQQHLDRLYDAWQRHDYYPGRTADLRQPIRVDFDFGKIPPFWGRNCEIGRVDDLLFEGRKAGLEPLLTSRGHLGPSAAWSHPFTIDFDRLDFLFSANKDYLTTAQLYVDGLLAYEVVGRDQPGGATASGPLERIEIPVYAWRGRQGALFFVSAEGDKGFFAADRVESQIFARRRIVDDFESGSYAPASWERGFGSAPVDNRRLAAVGSLAMVEGRFAATSLFAEGEQVMTSRPFLVDHRQLSFTVFDFGDGRTKIELRVDGRRQHFYAGRGRRQVDLVTWDLSDLQGQEAVLIVKDEDPSAEGGIGIDSILLHD